jgi:predicted nucleotidyltransferase
MDKKEIDRLKKLLSPVFRNTRAQKAYLFGSFSRGTGTHRSDIDLMIVSDSQKRFFDRYDEFEEIQSILSDSSVDMLIYTPDELSRISHRRFIKNIIEKGVVLYER